MCLTTFPASHDSERRPEATTFSQAHQKFRFLATKIYTYESRKRTARKAPLSYGTWPITLPFSPTLFPLGTLNLEASTKIRKQIPCIAKRTHQSCTSSERCKVNT